MVKVTEAVETVRGSAGPAAIRESVVASVMAGLRAAQLSGAEYLCVVSAILELIARAETEKAAIAVVAAAVVQGRVSSYATVTECSAPFLVSETVDMLVRMASPELWAQVRAALEASDEEIRARAAAHGRNREEDN